MSSKYNILTQQHSVVHKTLTTSSTQVTFIQDFEKRLS